MGQYVSNNIESKCEVKIINTRRNERNQVVVGRFNTLCSVSDISCMQKHK